MNYMRECRYAYVYVCVFASYDEPPTTRPLWPVCVSISGNISLSHAHTTDIHAHILTQSLLSSTHAFNIYMYTYTSLHTHMYVLHAQVGAFIADGLQRAQGRRAAGGRYDGRGGGRGRKNAHDPVAARYGVWVWVWVFVCVCV